MMMFSPRRKPVKVCVWDKNGHALLYDTVPAELYDVIQHQFTKIRTEPDGTVHLQEVNKDALLGVSEADNSGVHL